MNFQNLPNVCVQTNTQSASVLEGQDGPPDFVEVAPDGCEGYANGPQCFQGQAGVPPLKDAREMHQAVYNTATPWSHPGSRVDNCGPNMPPRGRDDHPGYPPAEGNFCYQNVSVPLSFHSVCATYTHAFSSDSCVGAATPSLRETPYYHPMVVNTPYAAPSAPRVDPFSGLSAEEIQLNLNLQNFPQSARDVHLPENNFSGPPRVSDRREAYLFSSQTRPPPSAQSCTPGVCEKPIPQCDYGVRGTVPLSYPARAETRVVYSS